jgi:hypothetical protein
VGQTGVGVDVGPISVQVGGVDDPGFGERLKAALTDFLKLFILTQGMASPGASVRAQGAGRPG